MINTAIIQKENQLDIMYLLTDIYICKIPSNQWCYPNVQKSLNKFEQTSSFYSQYTENMEDRKVFQKPPQGYN